MFYQGAIDCLSRKSFGLEDARRSFQPLRFGRRTQKRGGHESEEQNTRWSGGTLAGLLIIGGIANAVGPGTPAPKPKPAVVSTTQTPKPAISTPSPTHSVAPAAVGSTSPSPSTSPTPTLTPTLALTHSAAPPPAPPPAPPAPPALPATTPPAAPAPASCYPTTSSGHCYEPGEYCRKSDHGASGVAGDGKKIICEDNDGWRWEPV